MTLTEVRDAKKSALQTTITVILDLLDALCSAKSQGNGQSPHDLALANTYQYYKALNER